MYNIIEELESLQKKMESKALEKDPSIIMEVLMLDELIEELKEEY